MSGSLEPVKAEMRASHDDRELAVERLRVAAGDGRLGPADLDERIERALAATTLGELREVLRDLPVPAEDELVLRAKHGNVERSGVWTLPRRLRVDVRSANATIDLTRAVAVHTRLDVAVAAAHGNVRIIAPPDVEVEVGGVEVRAGNVLRRKREESAPARLRVRVEGEVRHGNVIVAGPRRTLRERLRRRG
ncbi:DUF1707 SHOCT-like domain-containing protein [Actinomadura sp. WAC 06369]|uniref:DUF1707 SHOCT-like domain-containing protein n=1 Tax=Actinomadura sp. WAC 06369 TaxID=2203193 RepID=UPI000F7683C7|nr:DUF1707 domain-containing protein [Actinomadura sp. WAC 06369]RSN51362.1 DUF1707 domain-containing protein [Actinomadura sp. WAC 06369]